MSVSMRGASVADAVPAPGEEAVRLPRLRRRAVVGAAAVLIFLAVCAAHVAIDRGLLDSVAAIPVVMRAVAGTTALFVGAVLLATYLARREAYALVIGGALVASGLLLAMRVVVTLVGLQFGATSPAAAPLFDVSIRTGWAQNMLLPAVLLLGALLVGRPGARHRDGSHRLFVLLTALLTAVALAGPWDARFPGGIRYAEVVARPDAAWSVSLHLLLLVTLWRRNALTEVPVGRWLRFAVYVSLLNQLMVLPFWLQSAAAASSALGAVMNLVAYAIIGCGVLVGIYVSARNEHAAREVALQQERERARVEAALARQAARLQHANEELAQYAYLASHDLQEPLRMVTNYLQLSERRYRDVLDEDGRQFMHFAVDGAVRMKRLTNDLLAYSRVSTRSVDPRPTDTAEALAAARKNLEVAIAETGAVVTADDLPTLPVDAVQLVQLFQNLIGNALKFRREGVPPRVHVRAERDGPYWRFSVADNGIGIDPKYQDKVFAVFQRLHRGDLFPGSGIGLALCRKIVERHGGRIWFEGEVEVGTTFVFTLPDAPEVQAPPLVEEDAELERRVSTLIERARELI